MIQVYCYTKQTFETRTKARRFFREGVRNSKGAECVRYQNVLYDIDAGFNICWDQRTLLSKEVEVAYNKQLER